MIRNLQQKAAAGDPRAKALLAKTLAAVRERMAQQEMLNQVESGALDHLLVQPGAEEVAGLDDDGNVRDELDVADDLLRLNPTADDLSHKSSLKQHQKDAQASIAPHYNPNPSSVSKGTLGGQDRVPTGENRQVANWPGDDSETRPVSIVFAPVQQIGETPNEPPILRPFGIIQFGTRGFLTRAEVDIGLGCQFTVPASAVTLQVAMEPSTPPGSMILAGMLSFNPIVRWSPITRTLYGDQVGWVGTSVAPFIVPPFAKNVSFWRNPITTAVTLFFLDSSGAESYRVVLAANTIMTDPIPLSGDIVSIGTDVGLVGLTSAKLIFGLSF